MFTRITLDVGDDMANADHVIGALAITVVIASLAETGRAARFCLVPLGLALFVTPFIYGVGIVSVISSLICGLALIALSLRKGKIHNPYGLWDKAIV